MSQNVAVKTKGDDMPRDVSLKFPPGYDDNTEKSAGITCCICSCSIPTASKWVCCTSVFGVIGALINFFIWAALFFMGVSGTFPFDILMNMPAANISSSLWHAYMIDEGFEHIVNTLVSAFGGAEVEEYEPPVGFLVVCFIGSLLYLIARCVIVCKINKLSGCCGPKKRDVAARSEAVKAILITLAARVIFMIIEMILYKAKIETVFVVGVGLKENEGIDNFIIARIINIIFVSIWYGYIYMKFNAYKNYAVENNFP